MDSRRTGIIALGLTIFAIVDGLLLGFFVAWWSQPPIDVAPDQTDADDYVWLVSVNYTGDYDLAGAQRRLSWLQPDSALAAVLVAEVSRRAAFVGNSGQSEPLRSLAMALGADVQMASLPEWPAAEPEVAPEPTHEPLPEPSNTPNATPTRAVILAAAAVITVTLPTRTPPPAASATRQPPTRTPMPVRRAPAPPRIVQGVDFQVNQVRRLSACENGGNHHLYVVVTDIQGNGIPAVPVEIVWASGKFVDYTGKKVESLPLLGITPKNTSGYLNFPMYHGSYKVRVLSGVSQQTDWLTVDIPQSERCAANDNPQGNSLFHYSYLIVFAKVR